MENNENQQFQQVEEQEIDLVEVFFVLWGKAWILLLSLVVGVVAAGLFTLLAITPQYEAQAEIYILSKTTSITSLADLQIGASLAADFQIIATTREVVQPVMDDLGIDEKYESFVNTIEVTNPTNSHMLELKVTNPDPVLAAKVCNALAEQLRMRIAEVMSTDTPSSVSDAVVPDTQSSPNLVVNCLVGGLIFFAIAAAAILISHFMDDTIKDEDDVRRYLGLDTLAAIPLEHFTAEEGKDGKSHKGHKGHKGHKDHKSEHKKK